MEKSSLMRSSTQERMEYGRCSIPTPSDWMIDWNSVASLASQKDLTHGRSPVNSYIVVWCGEWYIPAWFQSDCTTSDPVLFS